MGPTRLKRTARLLLLVAALGACWPALAARADQPPDADTLGEGPGRGRSRQDRLERLASRLGLDAATQAKIQKIVDAARDDRRPLRDRVHALRDDLRAALAGDAPDAQAVMRLADRIGEAETALHKHRLETLLRIRELLTPDQRRELVRLFEERRGRR